MVPSVLEDLIFSDYGSQKKKIPIILRIKAARSIFGESGPCVPVPVLPGVAIPPAQLHKV